MIVTYLRFAKRVKSYFKKYSYANIAIINRVGGNVKEESFYVTRLW